MKLEANKPNWLREAIKNRLSKIENRPGFTLVELLLVIAIVVILATIAAVSSNYLAQRDGVRRGSNAVMGALAQAKNRALRDQRNTGVRLLCRIRNGEIPQNILSQLTDAKGYRPPVQPITFADLNTIAANRAPLGPARDGNGNGFIDAEDLILFLTSVPIPGWADHVDNDGNVFQDDLVYIDTLEFVQDPGPFIDAWVWGPQYTAPGSPPRTLMVPDFTLPTYPPIVPVAVPPPPPPSPGNLPFSIIYGPFTAQWRDALGNLHPPQRATGLWDAALRQEIQPGDILELNGGGQTYEVIDARRVGFPESAVRPNPMPPSTPQLTPGGLVVRPLSGDVSAPMNSLANYRILRRPRAIQEKPIPLPRDVVVNISPVNTMPACAPGTPAYSTGPQALINGLSYGFPAPTLLPGGQVAYDIVFAPDGRVLDVVADPIYFWVTDVSEGNADNQALVRLKTRSGALGVYPVDWDLNKNQGNPYYLADYERTDE